MDFSQFNIDISSFKQPIEEWDSNVFVPDDALWTNNLGVVEHWRGGRFSGTMVDYYESEVWLLEFIVEKCGDFLDEASNQALFEATNITWHYFIVLLEELLNYRISTRFQSSYDYCVLNCLKLHNTNEKK
jgi:hypothetical protein